MAARWMLETSAFLVDTLHPAGTVLDYDGPPALHFRPMNEEAEKALAEYLKANPHASLDPFNSLARSMEKPEPIRVTVVAEPAKPTMDNGIAGLAEALQAPAIPQELALANLGHDGPEVKVVATPAPAPSAPKVTPA